ncbi:MAG: twin-arginine translocase TatA/TatE family subunit [Gammaproteobacteria bacterium]|nr:twin-arginine translocase TatA/TatE family subunit [Gammaproteobacteria bacterium]
MPGGPELIWVFIIFFLLFGAKKLPELAKSAGESLKEFKKATREAMAEEQQEAAAESQRRMEVSAPATPASDGTSVTESSIS